MKGIVILSGTPIRIPSHKFAITVGEKDVGFVKIWRRKKTVTSNSPNNLPQGVSSGSW